MSPMQPDHDACVAAQDGKSERKASNCCGCCSATPSPTLVSCVGTGLHLERKAMHHAEHEFDSAVAIAAANAEFIEQQLSERLAQLRLNVPGRGAPGYWETSEGITGRRVIAAAAGPALNDVHWLEELLKSVWDLQSGIAQIAWAASRRPATEEGLIATSPGGTELD